MSPWALSHTLSLLSTIFPLRVGRGGSRGSPMMSGPPCLSVIPPNPTTFHLGSQDYPPGVLSLLDTLVELGQMVNGDPKEFSAVPRGHTLLGSAIGFGGSAQHR